MDVWNPDGFLRTQNQSNARRNMLLLFCRECLPEHHGSRPHRVRVRPQGQPITVAVLMDVCGVMEAQATETLGLQDAGPMRVVGSLTSSRSILEVKYS